MLVTLVVPGADAIHGRVLFEKPERLGEVGEEVWTDVQILLQNDHVLGQRVDVEGGGEGGLVVLGDAGVLRT